MMLAVTWVMAPEDSKGRFQSIWDPTAGPEAETARFSAEGRIVGLKAGWEMFRRFPLTGVGLANFGSYRKNHLDGSHLVAHNMIGGVLGETGLIGGIAFLFVLFGVLVNCRKTRLLAKRNPHIRLKLLSSLSIACRDSLILLLFMGLFSDNQARIQLYWIAAFCLLTRGLAEDVSTRFNFRQSDSDNQIRA